VVGRLAGKRATGIAVALRGQFAEAVLLSVPIKTGNSPRSYPPHWGGVDFRALVGRERLSHAAITSLLREPRYEFPLEWAIVMTVLHRLVASGSERAAERWRRDYASEGVKALQLHHLYRRWGGSRASAR
jgi:hypothetical protein